MGFGQRLTHSIASWSDLHFHSQNPATASLVSGNGPSVTIRFCPENLTRAPFELGCNPSPASITPALFNSSLNLLISARSWSLGILPASEFLLALTITMNLILLVPLRQFGFRQSSSRAGQFSLRIFLRALFDRASVGHRTNPHDRAILKTRTLLRDLDRFVLVGDRQIQI